MSDPNVVVARNTDQAPVSDLYSQTVAFSHYNNLSAQLPIDPATGAIVAGGAAEQAEQCFENLEAIVESIDHSLNDVARITVFVRDIREIRFTNEEVPPVIGPFVDDGHDYTQPPQRGGEGGVRGARWRTHGVFRLGPRLRQAHHRRGVLAR